MAEEWESIHSNSEIKKMLRKHLEDSMENTEQQLKLFHLESMENLSKCNQDHINELHKFQKYLSDFSNSLNRLHTRISELEIKINKIESKVTCSCNPADTLTSKDITILNDAYYPLINSPFYDYSRIRNLKIRKKDQCKFMPEPYKNN